MIKQKTFFVKFQKFAIVFIKTMFFTQKLVHVDTKVCFNLVMKHCQISYVNQFSFFVFFVDFSSGKRQCMQKVKLDKAQERKNMYVCLL